MKRLLLFFCFKGIHSKCNSYIQWDSKDTWKCFYLAFLYTIFFFHYKTTGYKRLHEFGNLFWHALLLLTAGTQAVCTSQFGAKPDDPYHPDFMNVLRSMSKSEANLTFCTEGIDFWVPMYSF